MIKLSDIMNLQYVLMGKVYQITVYKLLDIMLIQTILIIFGLILKILGDISGELMDFLKLV